MENTEIARVLFQIANLLELHDENAHRVKAYRKGAEALLLIPEPATALAHAGRLGELPGIGPSLTAQIEELLARGTTTTLEGLKGRTEPALLSLLSVRGLTPRLARLIWERHGIDTPERLAQALLSGELRDLPGLGPREEEALLRALARGPLEAGHPNPE